MDNHLPIPSQLYRPSLALLTDLYQLTMAFSAWHAGIADHETVFHLFFRHNPYDSGFSICCGLENAIDYLRSLKFTDEDVDYLSTLTASDGSRLFPADFLRWLKQASLEVDVDAIPEGTAVFAYEPLVRVRGPVIPCMLIETPLLNIVNFQTLVATKAARVVLAAQGEPVQEFGLRRAQGMDGALSASRAAFIGGCSGTSNLFAGRLYGIPVGGTHAHSWVMLFDDELEAFEAYARALPANCILLVDTYDTMQGVRHAIEVGKMLRNTGHELLAIRLDSGDLAYLSIEARKLLDSAGLHTTRIVASNELDEQTIASLKQQHATISLWGVGTRLVTGYPDAALGGVYKLGATRAPGQPWKYPIKVSEQAAKTTIPGVLQVRRFSSRGELAGDGIFDVERGWPDGDNIIVDPLDLTRRKRLPAGTSHEDLLIPVLRSGKCVYESPPLVEIRQRTHAQVEHLNPGIKRFLNPHQYPVGIERSLHDLRTARILKMRHAEF